MKHIIGISAIFFFALSLIASTNSLYTVFFSPNEADIFTKENFREYMKSTKQPTIVVRVPTKDESNLNSEDKLSKVEYSQSDIYNTIEKELSRANFVVRDRKLFEKVLDQNIGEYAKIREATETELILELVSFVAEEYKTNKYKDKNGIERVASDREFTNTGYRVEFKLIKVLENDVVGSYTFHYAPCVDGCSYGSEDFKLFNDSSSGETKGYKYVVSQTALQDFFKKCTIELIDKMYKN
jgi:hypothetical protein